MHNNNDKKGPFLLTNTMAESLLLAGLFAANPVCRIVLCEN
jgi:hypothetical protein